MKRNQQASATGTRRHTLAKLHGIAGLLIAITASDAASSLQAQQQPPLPRREYYGVFNDLYSGEYNAAARGLDRVSGLAMRVGDEYFLDSVCYWTMLGECFYRVGNYAAAIEQYENALRLYSGLQAWPARIESWPDVVEDAAAVRRAGSVTWGTSTRGARYGSFDHSVLIRLGKTDAENEAAVRGGGVVDPPRLRSIDMTEIMRCVSLALYRRQMIKGPVCKLDPLTRQLSTALGGAGGATRQTAWPGVARGIALASMEDWANAQTILTNSLRIEGADHPLTPIALLVLGHAAASQGNLPEAGQLYLEASIAAVAYEQYDLIEESLHYAAILHASQQTGTPFAPLSDAIAWAKRERADALHFSLLADAAMIAAETGDAASANAAIDDARQAMRGNELKDTLVHTRLLYAIAHTLYVQNDLARGDKAFGDFVQHAQVTSRWLYQIMLVDAATRSNNVTDRDADLLYDALLREPRETDWQLRPEESMAWLATPHLTALEHWFEVSLIRKAEEQAIEIAELIRRHRFLSEIPMGGRLLALRWILEAPDDALSESARKQKQALLVRYPAWKELSAQATQVLEALEKLPFDPPNSTDERVQQKKLLEQLADLTGQQEMLLRKISLTREPCELAFPRPLTTPQIQQAMRPNQLMVQLLRIGESYHVMTLGGGRYSIEGAVQARDLDRKILELLKQISVGEKSAVYDADEFAAVDWRETALEISRAIFQKPDQQSLAAIEELIVIPDGKAWYLPFELLQTGVPGSTTSLADSVRVRYAPMATLGVPDGRTSRRFQRRAIVAQTNFNRDSEEQINAGLTRMREAMPDLLEIPRTFTGPSSLLAPTLDQLYVWHENRSGSREGPFSISPLQVDDGRPGADLSEWVGLPWRGPDQLVWTGLSTDIEGSTRSNADGSELFYMTTAMMASGVRTALVSRWRVGGKSTLDLTREFAIGLNQPSPPAEAWKRSVDLFRAAELDLAGEPRVRPVELAQPLTGEAPFFWAGYMLVDGGGATGVVEKSPLPATPEETDPASPDADGR